MDFIDGAAYRRTFSLNQQEASETVRTRWETFTRLAKEHGNKLPADHPLFTESHRTYKDGIAPFFAQPYDGQPIFISEYGGIQWVHNAVSGWGYGNAPATEEAFFARYRGLTEALLPNEDIFGFCYTQLYDIEQEINGIYTYDRKEKFDTSIIREINRQKARIEE